MTERLNSRIFFYDGEQFGRFLIKVNMQLLYDLAIVVLGIYARETKTYVHKQTCTGMSMATLFIIVLR